MRRPATPQAVKTLDILVAKHAASGRSQRSQKTILIEQATAVHHLDLR
jgi:hypothetical protein